MSDITENTRRKRNVWPEKMVEESGGGIGKSR